MARTSLVTGASVGIGCAIARALAARGDRLVLVARRRDALDALAAELRARHGVAVDVVPQDLTAPDAGRTIAEAVAALGVEVDLLVNNAGVGSWGDFWTLDERRELEQIQVNVAALVQLTRRFVPGMVARRRGHVVNIGSTAGFQPGPRMATYFATKAFVLSFSEALAYELRGTGVAVTCYCPGPVATEFGAVSGNEKSMLFARPVAGPDETAADVLRAIDRRDVVAVQGWALRFSTIFARFLPRRLVVAVTARINAPAPQSGG
jgi:short-subunit dehydrogenase